MLREIDACTHEAAACGVPAADLPDIAQAARLAAWQALERGDVFATVGHVRAWFRGVGRNLASNYQRRGARAVLLLDLDELEAKGPTVPDAETLSVARTPRVLLDEALAELARTRPEVHLVVEQHDLQDRSMREIAAEQGIELGTAWNRRHIGWELLTAAVARAAAREQGGRR